MILSNNIDRLQMNDSTLKEHLIVKFDVDLEFCDNEKENKATFYVEFDENGNVFKFPDIKTDSDDPKRYISLAKVVEEVLSYQGNRAKATYDKAIDLKEYYIAKRQEFMLETHYNDLLIKSANISNSIHDILYRVKQTKKLKDKESMQRCADILIEEHKLLNDNEITPLELQLAKIDLDKAKAISQLVL